MGLLAALRAGLVVLRGVGREAVVDVSARVAAPPTVRFVAQPPAPQSVLRHLVLQSQRLAGELLSVRPFPLHAERPAILHVQVTS